jgi:type IV pilus assembly protein PilA
VLLHPLRRLTFSPTPRPLPDGEHRARPRTAREEGFSLIELLVVMIIIGILAAIAIPSFLSTTGKAIDAQAKELARTAQTTAEAIASVNDGSYQKVTLAELAGEEPTIPIEASTAHAYLSAASANSSSFSVTAKATDGDELTISKTAEGTVTRKCFSPVTKTGCAGGEASSW